LKLTIILVLIINCEKRQKCRKRIQSNKEKIKRGKREAKNVKTKILLEGRK
jgi:hypothetical protein